MLIINQSHDVLFDTTSAMIRIAYRETTKKYVVLGINGGYGSVELFTLDTEEDAKKVLTIIKYAMALDNRILDFSAADVANNLDVIIEGFETLMKK